MGEYGQFCPVAKAAELLCQRWTVLVVRELLLGSTRFGDLQRGVPGCPPATLSKRLRELEAAGVITRSVSGGGREVTYEPTEAGWELYPIVEGFGRWGQRWVRSTYPDGELDPDLLLWDVRRFLDPAGLGVERAVVQLDVRTSGRGLRRYWVVVADGGVDLCMVDPDQPVDVVVGAHVRDLARIWMGEAAMADAVASGAVTVTGPPTLARRLPAWFGRHPVLGGIAPAR